jgi:hypothetical protein
MANADAAAGAAEIDDDLASHEEHLRLAYDIGRTFLAMEHS